MMHNEKRRYSTDGVLCSKASHYTPAAQLLSPATRATRGPHAAVQRSTFGEQHTAPRTGALPAYEYGIA